MNFLNKIYQRILRSYLVQQKKSKLNKIKTNLFQNRVLTWNPQGFYALSPMPAEEDLDKYYENAYWAVRGDQKVLLKDRDNDHWMILQPFLEAMENSSIALRCLNIGAGHGGISHLLFARGHAVTNYEPSTCRSVFNGSRWVSVQKLEDLDKQQFEVIYASHSLEHVQDIQRYMQMIDGMLASGGLCFFEVPNCRQTNTSLLRNGGQNGKVIPPHTYYFTTDFFKNLPYERMLLGTYSQSAMPNGLVKGDDGDVIRYLGRKP